MSNFKVEVQPMDSFVVLRSEGYINNLGGEQIAVECFRLMEEGYDKFILNLNNSKVVNSIGISILIEIIEKIISREGRLAFTNLTPTIAKTFKIMGLLQFTELFNDEYTAIDAFREQ